MPESVYYDEIVEMDWVAVARFLGVDLSVVKPVDPEVREFKIRAHQARVERDLARLPDERDEEQPGCGSA